MNPLTDTDFLGVIIPFTTAVAGGLWGVKKWSEERNATRLHDAQMARDRLEQLKLEEIHRREDKAAELVLALGAAEGSAARTWTATALALYPDESLRLLINALGHADDETATAIDIALASIGPKAMAELCRMNRVAQNIVATNTFSPPIARNQPGTELRDHDGSAGDAETDHISDNNERSLDGRTPGKPRQSADVIGANRILSRSRSAIAYLILQCEAEELCDLDVAGVDLQAMNFAGARMEQARLRKALLNRSIFARAKLNGANFRGAELAGAVFSRAILSSSDFTGVQGPIIGIRMRANTCNFADARLEGSTLEAANLTGASFLRTNLTAGRLAGANLTGATVANSTWNKIIANKSSMAEAKVVGLRMSHADVREAKWHHARFERCNFTRLQAIALLAEQAEFIDCNFGGADLTKAQLSGSSFTRCNFSNTSLKQAQLDGAVFNSCRFFAASFVDARMNSTRFTGTTQFDPERFTATGARWETASFEDGSESLQAVFARSAALPSHDE